METVEYIGKDLEAMSFAENYHRWILHEFRPYIGRHLVEVGAGTGDFSKLLLGEDIDSLTLVEPSAMFGSLRENLSSASISLRFHQNIFANVGDEIARTRRPDTLIYINVLEHIEDDAHELNLMFDCLSSGGKVLIFVPALPRLYGPFDRAIGHYRRYVKRDLLEMVKQAGFSAIQAKYFDFVGIIPWFVKYKLFRSDSLESGLIKTYDKFIVPVNRFAESLVTPPIGKNLLFVLQKP